MHRPAAAGHQQRELPRVAPVLGDVHAGGAGHRLVHQRVDAGGRLLPRQPQPARQPRPS